MSVALIMSLLIFLKVTDMALLQIYDMNTKAILLAHGSCLMAMVAWFSALNLQQAARHDDLMTAIKQSKEEASTPDPNEPPAVG